MRRAIFFLPVAVFVACVGKDADPTGGEPGNDAGVDGSGSSSGDSGGAGTDSGGGDGSADDATTASDGALPTTPGDILVLEGSGLVGSIGGPVTEWKSNVGSLVAKPFSSSRPTIGEYAKKPSEKCLVFSGQQPLVVAASADIDLGTQDFSVTVAVIRGPSHADATEPRPDHGRVVVARNTLGPGYDYEGFALLSDWQSLDNIQREPRWAARHASIATAGTGFEVAGGYRPVDSVREVVAMYRRGDELFLRDEDGLHGPKAGASGYTISSPDKPLTIGQADAEVDYDTRFAGSLCALVIHRGAESDADILARIDALRAKYPKQ